MLNVSTTFDMQDGAYVLGIVQYFPGIWLKTTVQLRQAHGINFG
jgi:hypothetical protein